MEQKGDESICVQVNAEYETTDEAQPGWVFGFGHIFDRRDDGEAGDDEVNTQHLADNVAPPEGLSGFGHSLCRGKYFIQNLIVRYREENLFMVVSTQSLMFDFGSGSTLYHTWQQGI